MNATSLAVSVQPGAGVIVGVDLAKSVFQLCVVDSAWGPVESQRLSRAQFERWFANRAVSRVVMEACGSAHHWARWLTGLGIEVTLLPARYVRAYVKRNKTDAADAAALLEAARCSELRPVRVKSVEQQALQALHRTRSLWQADRTRRINTLRGYCREFGIAIGLGARSGLEQIARVLAEPRSGIPELLRATMVLLVQEVRLLEARVAQLERELAGLARHSAACTTLLSVPGIGLLTSTAMAAATSGDVSHFRSPTPFTPSQPCAEIDRPPWHPGSPPQRTTPITLPAAPTATSRLPLRTIGAALTQIPCRHGHSQHSPHQMPDIRLQAQPFVHHPDRSIAGVGGGVHIRGVRPMRLERHEGRY